MTKIEQQLKSINNPYMILLFIISGALALIPVIKFIYNCLKQLKKFFNYVLFGKIDDEVTDIRLTQLVRLPTIEYETINVELRFTIEDQFNFIPLAFFKKIDEHKLLRAYKYFVETVFKGLRNTPLTDDLNAHVLEYLTARDIQVKQGNEPRLINHAPLTAVRDYFATPAALVARYNQYVDITGNRTFSTKLNVGKLKVKMG